MVITYRKATRKDMKAMTDLLFQLYDGEGLGLSRGELLAENDVLLADVNQVFFFALDSDKPVGISHGSLRREYVNGANDGRKGYLEAIYVLRNTAKQGLLLSLSK